MRSRDSDHTFTTPREKAVFELLVESGATESGTDAEGRNVEDGPPYGAAMLIDMTLSSFPSEDQLVDVLTWGDRSSWEAARPLARKLLALIDDH